jgi:large subunit ribosomal protein L6
MSRVAKQPVIVPAGVTVDISGAAIMVKGPKGTLQHSLNSSVSASLSDGVVKFSSNSTAKNAIAQAGTARALVANMVYGVEKGFAKSLDLVGVGYRAQAQGAVLKLSLGFSHPIEFTVPSGIGVETPSQTQIVVSGADKQQVGQVAAKIRAFRPPEPYKGKGVKYSDEHIVRKEAKKK